MTLKIPDSMDECLYFTNRTIDSGKVLAWARRKPCPKCKALMGLPLKKTGKPDKKATIYKCPECGYEEDRTEHEESLMLEVQYTCPKCNFQGETTIPYKRKKFYGVDAYVFTCDKCGEKIGITKKMKRSKKKKT